MRFKKDDDVIVRLEDKSTRTGKFVKMNGKKMVVAFEFPPLSEVEFESIQVREYEPIDDEVTDAWCKMETPNIVEIIQRGMESIFPGCPYQLKTQDGSIEMDGFSLEPATLRVEAIAGVREVPGFQLVSWKYHYATRTEPEDVTDTPVSDHRTSLSAAAALMKISIANHVDRWFESESEARYAESLEQEQESDGFYG